MGLHAHTHEYYKVFSLSNSNPPPQRTKAGIYTVANPHLLYGAASALPDILPSLAEPFHRLRASFGPPTFVPFAIVFFIAGRCGFWVPWQSSSRAPSPRSAGSSFGFRVLGPINTSSLMLQTFIDSQLLLLLDTQLPSPVFRRSRSPPRMLAPLALSSFSPSPFSAGDRDLFSLLLSSPWVALRDQRAVGLGGILVVHSVNSRRGSSLWCPFGIAVRPHFQAAPRVFSSLKTATCDHLSSSAWFTNDGLWTYRLVHTHKYSFSTDNVFSLWFQPPPIGPGKVFIMWSALVSFMVSPRPNIGCKCNFFS